MGDCPTGPSPYPSDCEITEGLRKMAQNKAVQSLDERLIARAKQIRLLLLDVDGVLTDGTLFLSAQGDESKGFNTQDGFGIRLLQEAGIDVGVITARSSAVVKSRCENLNMKYVYQGNSDKLQAYNDILKKSGLKPFEIGYMGDDWLDLILLKRVGFAATPANGVPEVKDAVHYTTSQHGGRGAVREVCDIILQAKGVHQQLLQSYLSR
jgi:3-deoxy-D-manno-octulosonate 8-phosphate phosphatase (KDO 8-P phosphatase)